MSDAYQKIAARSKGAWVVHHGQKTASIVSGAAEFPALDAAGKAASLLSQLAATDQTTVEKPRVEALAKAAGLNPKIELPELLNVLQRRRVIQTSVSGDVEILGLTSAATVQHAADIFEEQGPTSEEQASIVIAEATSLEPISTKDLSELISDEFKLSLPQTGELLLRSEEVGFVDAEGNGLDKLYFNGNIFRRESITKTKRVLASLSPAEGALMMDLDQRLHQHGCLSVSAVERHLGAPLFAKLKAAGMYDVNQVANPSGEFGFVTRPSAFHKFNDPMSDDAFDLAKALVSALFYGMTQSSSGRGKIALISVLLGKLIRGAQVGPATAIGEDYRVLEQKGVIRVQPARPYGYFMRLLKRDIGEMALKVLTTGETASTNALDRPFPGMMTDYSGPEKTRSEFRRRKQLPASKRQMQDVLQALRTQVRF